MSELFFSARKRGLFGRAMKLDIHWDPEQTALLVIDMWDKHWCRSATKRAEQLVPHLAQVVDKARERGITIIHIPCDIGDYYAEFPQRARLRNEPSVPTPPDINEPLRHNQQRWGRFPLRGGCACRPKCEPYKAWRKQHDLMRIEDNDLITDRANEIYSYARNNNIENLIYTGLHANLCILSRPIGIRKMVSLGLNCILLRDSTDVMHDSSYTHERAMSLMMRHIEKNFCPTALSQDLLSG